MTRTLNRFTHRFTAELPTVGLGGHVSVACSGEMVISGPLQYLLVPVTNGATVRMGPAFSVDLGPAGVASGRPVMEIHDMRLPTFDDFRRWRKEENVARRPTMEEIARMQIDTFLEEVYRLAKIDADGATDRVFDFIDRLLCDGLFGVCDEILSKVDVERLPTTLMRSFLSITDAAKHKLPSRRALYRKIESKMTVLRGADKTRRIIGNLA